MLEKVKYRTIQAMARSDPQLNFRCPAGLKEKLEAAAVESGRSVTQELVFRLERSFEGDSFTPSKRAELLRLLDELLEEKAARYRQLSGLEPGQVKADHSAGATANKRKK